MSDVRRRRCRVTAFVLSTAIADELLSHARAALPNEACALLGGDPAAGRATSVHPVRNAHASPYRYAVGPNELVRAIFAMERAGESLVAIFHSHPAGPGRPSATDVREARYPEAIHLIAGRHDDASFRRIRAWRLDSPSPSELALVLA